MFRNKLQRKEFYKQTCMLSTSNWKYISKFQEGRCGKSWDEGSKLAKGGHLELLKLLSERRFFPMEDAFINACKSGNLPLIEWVWAYEKSLVQRLNVPVAALEKIEKQGFLLTVSCGHAGVARWFVQKHADDSSWLHKSALERALKIACRKGHLGILEWGLATCSQFRFFSEYSMRLELAQEAVLGGHLEALKLLLLGEKRLSDALGKHEDYNLTNLMDNAAVQGSLLILEWLHEKFNARCWGATFYLDAEMRACCNNIQVLEWLKSNQSTVYRDGEYKFGPQRLTRTTSFQPPKSGRLEGLASKGQYSVIKWYLEHPGREGEGEWRITDDLVSKLMDVAAWHGHLNCVEALHQRYGTWCRNRMTVVRAARNGHLGTVEWLCANQKSLEWNPSKAIIGAARNGHLQMLEWLHQSLGYLVEPGVFDEAAGGGHVSVVEWLHRKGLGGGSVSAMDDAAQNNHMAMVEWLHTNRTEGCTKLAMDSAARLANLRLVEWFHHNRQEGCTAAAMDAAAGKGKLAVVEWLHYNRSEGCSTDAMDLAARGGHMNVLAWLNKTRTEGITDKAVHFKGRTNDEIVQRWMSKNVDRYSECLQQAKLACHRENKIGFFLY